MVEAHQAVGGASSRGKPDPNVVLPPAVRKAAERSEELMKQAKTAQAENEARGGNEPALKASAASTSTSASGVTMTDFQPNNPNPPKEVTSTSPPPPPPATPAGDEDWEQKFNSLRGRFEREQDHNKRMARQITDMQHLMATIGTAPASQPTTQPTPQSQNSGVRFDAPQGQPRYVTPEEVKEYGEELMDVVGRRAREIYEPVVAQLVGELNSVRQQLGGVKNTVTYDASVKMYEDLAKEVPDWETINASPEFGQWLDRVDPLTGQVRRNILNYSHRNNMTGSVIAAFRGFLADQASLSPLANGAVPGNGADSHRAVASTPQTDLRQFAAPGRAKTGQTQVPPEKPIFSTADITQFYRDKTAGKFAGREAEADAYERALYDAGREGRIRR